MSIVHTLTLLLLCMTYQHLAITTPWESTGLTDELIETLSTITIHMPHQRTIIQQRLLEEVVKVLGGDAHPKIIPPVYTYSWSHKGKRFPVEIADQVCHTTLAAVGSHDSDDDDDDRVY